MRREGGMIKVANLKLKESLWGAWRLGHLHVGPERREFDAS